MPRPVEPAAKPARSTPDEAAQRFEGPGPALALVGLVLVAFGEAAGFGYVWDDLDLIAGNPAVQGAGALSDLFTQDMWWQGGSADVLHHFWRPVTLAVMRVTLENADGRPAALHQLAIGLHAVVAVGAWRLLSRWMAPAAAFAAAALFAVHPLRVESVAWASGLGDVLCALGLVLAVNAYERAVDQPGRAGWGWALGAAVLGGLAALSKEPGFLLAPALIGWALVLPETRKRLTLALPSALVAAGVWAWRASVVTETRDLGFTVAQRLATAPALLARYVSAMALPVPWVLHDRSAAIDGVSLWGVLGLLVVVAAVGLLSWARAGRAPAVARGVVWCGVFLAPACWIGFSRILFAERYTYLPALGACALIVGAVGVGLERAPRRPSATVLRGAGLVLLMSLGAWTALRTTAWRSSESLYGEMLRQDARDPLASYNRGIAAALAGRNDAARRDFLRTVDVAPGHSFALTGLGNLDAMSGQLATADDWYTRAIAADPLNFEAAVNASAVRTARADCDGAERVLAPILVAGSVATPDVRDAAAERLVAVRAVRKAGGCR